MIPNKDFSIWLIGPSAAGKTTISKLLYENLKKNSNLILVDGDEHWFEFRFLFKDGKIDRKHLDDYTTRTEEELEKEEEEWAIIRSYYDAHKSRLSIKIYEWIGKKFLAVSTYFSRKSSIPEEIRKTAYKAAGKEYGRGSW